MEVRVSALFCFSGKLVYSILRRFPHKVYPMFRTHGRMRNTMCGKQLFQLMFGVLHVRKFADYDMESSCIFSGADSPYMQVMPAFHSGNPVDFCFQFFQLNLFGDSIQTQIQTFSEQFPGRQQNNDGDSHSDKGINDVALCKTDENSGKDYSHRNQGIHCHVQKRSLYVQVVFLAFHQEESCGPVDQDAYAGCPGNRLTRDGGRTSKFVDTFNQNASYGDEQDNSIDQ